MSILFSIIDSNHSEVGNFKTFVRDYPITPEVDEKITKLLRKLEKYDVQGLEVIIYTISIILLHNNDYSLYVNVLSYAEEIVEKISIVANQEIKSDNLFPLIIMLLNEKYRERLAIRMNTEVIQIAKDYSLSFSDNYFFSNLYSTLLEKYFDVTWPALSDALLSEGEEYWKYYNFKGLLGAIIGSPSSLNNVFFQEKNYEKFLLWCDLNPKIAPVRLAAITPVYQGDSFHPFVMFLLDIYGNNIEMLDSLSSNMGCFSWTGSVIPLYELKKKAFEQLLSHKNQIVAEWAKRQIEYTQIEILESQRREDEEKFFYS